MEIDLRRCLVTATWLRTNTFVNLIRSSAAGRFGVQSHRNVVITGTAAESCSSPQIYVHSKTIQFYALALLVRFLEGSLFTCGGF